MLLGQGQNFSFTMDYSHVLKINFTVTVGKSEKIARAVAATSFSIECLVYTTGVAVNSWPTFIEGNADVSLL